MNVNVTPDRTYVPLAPSGSFLSPGVPSSVTSTSTAAVCVPAGIAISDGTVERRYLDAVTERRLHHVDPQLVDDPPGRAGRDAYGT